jgi:hypothetical protein
VRLGLGLCREKPKRRTLSGVAAHLILGWMLIAIIPALVLVVGLLIYALSTNAKVSAIGFAMFQCGLLVTLFVLARTTVKLL